MSVEINVKKVAMDSFQRQMRSDTFDGDPKSDTSAARIIKFYSLIHKEKV